MYITLLKNNFLKGAIYWIFGGQEEEVSNRIEAEKILENWSLYRPKFLKVMPTEYRRALEEIKAEKEGRIVAAE